MKRAGIQFYLKDTDQSPARGTAPPPTSLLLIYSLDHISSPSSADPTTTSSQFLFTALFTRTHENVRKHVDEVSLASTNSSGKDLGSRTNVLIHASGDQEEISCVYLEEQRISLAETTAAII